MKHAHRKKIPVSVPPHSVSYVKSPRKIPSTVVAEKFGKTITLAWERKKSENMVIDLRPKLCENNIYQRKIKLLKDYTYRRAEQK